MRIKQTPGQKHINQTVKMKQKNIPYHPELAVQYLREIYGDESPWNQALIGPDSLARIYGLNVTPQQDGAPSRCTFRGAVISGEQAKQIQHAHLDGSLSYHVRTGFRKIGIGRRKKRFISDEAAEYIIDKLHRDLIAADLPRFPTKMVADRWGADSFWTLPELPSPDQLKMVWPEAWSLQTLPATDLELTSISCSALDVTADFAYAHWGPHPDDMGTLRWWILATAVREFVDSPKRSRRIAQELSNHAGELKLSKDFVELLMTEVL